MRCRIAVQRNLLWRGEDYTAGDLFQEVKKWEVHSTAIVGSPRWASVATPLLLEFGDVRLDPSKNCRMRQINAAFSPHIGEIRVAELVGDVPADAENYYRRIEVSPFEQR